MAQQKKPLSKALKTFFGVGDLGFAWMTNKYVFGDLLYGGRSVRVRMQLRFVRSNLFRYYYLQRVENRKKRSWLDYGPAKWSAES